MVPGLTRPSALICCGAGAVIVENLNVFGLVKGRDARVLADAAMGMFLRILNSTAEALGVLVLEAGPFYPSSKTCSACDAVSADLKTEELWRCASCGMRHDGDHNAAWNLHRQGLPVMETWRTCKSAAAAAGTGEASTGHLITAEAARSG